MVDYVLKLVDTDTKEDTLVDVYCRETKYTLKDIVALYYLFRDDWCEEEDVGCLMDYIVDRFDREYNVDFIEQRFTTDATVDF